MLNVKKPGRFMESLDLRDAKRSTLLRYRASGGAGLFSPLTPALSPLRGEGGKYLFPFNRRHGEWGAKQVPRLGGVAVRLNT
jgi:hypothetical protein